MSPRYERLMFRLGLLGLVIVVAVFVYRTEVNPPGPNGARRTTTTVEGATTTSSAPTTSVSTTAKPFSVLSPRDESRVTQPQILLAGVGNPGAVVARGEIATNVDARGVWALGLPLAIGTNELELVETAPDGSQQTASLTVFYEE